MASPDQSIPEGFCQCGCGMETFRATHTRPKYGQVRGEFLRYRRGHHQKLSRLTFDNQPSTKKCKMCGEVKLISAFGRICGGKPKLYSYCRKCATEKQKLLPIEYQLLNGARRRARKKGAVCTITRADIIVPEVCPILGIPLQRHRINPQMNSYSIDEIIPGGGYVAGNVQVLSKKANSMKSDANPAELRLFAAWVQRTFGV